MRCPTCNELMTLVLNQSEKYADITAACPNHHEWKLRIRSRDLLSSSRKVMENVEVENTPSPSPAPVTSSSGLARLSRSEWEKKYTAVAEALDVIKNSKDDETLQWAAKVIKRSMEEHVYIIVQAVKNGELSAEEALEIHKHDYPGIERLL